MRITKGYKISLHCGIIRCLILRYAIIYLNTNIFLTIPDPSQEQCQDKQRKTWRMAIPTLINEWKAKMGTCYSFSKHVLCQVFFLYFNIFFVNYYIYHSLIINLLALKRGTRSGSNS